MLHMITITQLNTIYHVFMYDLACTCIAYIL